MDKEEKKMEAENQTLFDNEDEVDGKKKKKKEDEMDKTEKSVVTEDDLQKSLDKLAEVTKEDDSVSRKDELLEKAQSSELEKAERDELFGLLGGSVDEDTEDDSIGEELVKSINENETVQKALDVSDYLEEQHKELCKSLVTLGEHIEKSDKRQHEFNLVLGKAVGDIGELVKSLSERIAVVENQPARAPKSKGITKGVAPMQKSFAEQPEEDTLSKSDILNSLTDMAEKSMQSGKGGLSESGHDLIIATSKFENSNSIHPTLLDEVKRFRAN